MADDRATAMAELSQAISHEILALPDLSAQDWDTYAMVAEVSDEVVRITAYRYTESGPPVPTRYPMVFDLCEELRERTRGADGEAWDVVIVRISRATAQVAMSFVAGEEADRWRISPATIDALPELLRPRREDFAS